MAQTTSRPYSYDTVAKTLVGTGGSTKLHSLCAQELDSAIRYIQLFNAAETGDVTLGTTEPDFVVPLAADGNIVLDSLEMSFPLGLVYAVTTTDDGSTPATATRVSFGVS